MAFLSGIFVCGSGKRKLARVVALHRTFFFKLSPHFLHPIKERPYEEVHDRCHRLCRIHFDSEYQTFATLERVEGWGRHRTTLSDHYMRQPKVTIEPFTRLIAAAEGITLGSSNAFKWD
jgi:hypothetical protein